MINIFRRNNNKKRKCYEKEKYNPYVSNNLVFIWGVKSRDDFTNNSANIFTMNDIDVVYNIETQRYIIGIEEAYSFDTLKDKQIYFTKLFIFFEKWYESMGYDIIKLSDMQLNEIEKQKILKHISEIVSYRVWNNCYVCQSKDIFDLYIKFKFFVKEYNKLTENPLNIK